MRLNWSGGRRWESTLPGGQSGPRNPGYDWVSSPRSRWWCLDCPMRWSCTRKRGGGLGGCWFGRPCVLISSWDVQLFAYGCYAGFGLNNGLIPAAKVSKTPRGASTEFESSSTSPNLFEMDYKREDTALSRTPKPWHPEQGLRGRDI